MDPALIVIIVFFAIVFFLFVFMEVGQGQLAREWKVYLEGDFDRVEYGFYEYTTRSGTMVHSTHYHKMDVTAFYLIDGRSCTAAGRYDMPYPRGTRIRIWRNGVGQLKVENT